MRSALRMAAALVAGLAFAGALWPTVAAQSKPANIVLIVTDDMGYADIGVHGSRDIPTPNIDALMKGGTRFTDAYVSGPYCSPTRAGLLTGRYPQRFGHEFNIGVGPKMVDFGLPVSERTLADRLKAAGYRTAAFGKWHLGSAGQFHPMSRGFDEFFGFLGGQHSYTDVGPDNDLLLDGRKPVANVTYLTDELGDRAVDFIQRNRTSPFFLYLAFNAVHTPMQAPQKYLARFPTIANPDRRAYAAMLSAMDDAIGKTMEAIRVAGLDENTLVIFLNDNGGPTMAGTTINASSNAPLRGSKRQTWEGGIRVALAMRWRGRIPQSRIEHRPVIQLDVFPTALAAAGLELPAGGSGNVPPLDGVNLLPFITGSSLASPHDVLYWRLGDHMAIRQGDWKLVKTQEGALREGTFDTIESLAEAQLFNLANDISESKNLAATEPAKARELAEAWLRWNKALAKPLWPPGGGGGVPH